MSGLFLFSVFYFQRRESVPPMKILIKLVVVSQVDVPPACENAFWPPKK
jgi:hypothetical protein